MPSDVRGDGGFVVCCHLMFAWVHTLVINFLRFWALCFGAAVISVRAMLFDSRPLHKLIKP